MKKQERHLISIVERMLNSRFVVKFLTNFSKLTSNRNGTILLISIAYMALFIIAPFIGVFGIDLNNKNLSDWVNVAVFFNNAFTPFFLLTTVFLLFATWNTSRREFEETNKQLALQTSVLLYDKVTDVLPTVVKEIDEWLDSPVDSKVMMKARKNVKNLPYYEELTQISKSQDDCVNNTMTNKAVFSGLWHSVSKIRSNPKLFRNNAHQCLYAHAIIADANFVEEACKHYVLLIGLLTSLESDSYSRLLYKTFYSNLNEESQIPYFLEIVSFKAPTVANDKLSLLLNMSPVSGKIKGKDMYFEQALFGM
ncbi:hypothetical protein CTT31_20820 [Pseudoalteromonas maricaloris]|uniref:hypothetical protein n=1 Tax=Pseudoalteromonas maricaloris TaxID=184924 RepID=UPI0021AD5595|nr:hypothetical protein [Pseudoalteromonas flavipulchra]USE71529.1 hypothetical protein CTT31_20820 [Pseudoalteromonas flavipulchra]